ncbi:hypothetical protein GALMADRAFT_223126 [Galerina marginata CBS 339.88]|uniref:Glucose receptor Git3 N-terminal domain-containing protein n=1 Tax=Galerina marginata (strain CBS 339.88) TaxID=685588 RepID=A0A067TAQ0_GALM3|nr:hypothetical protein GALMADRAFT_223126 [Galerina marginata CBS 339.88]
MANVTTPTLPNPLTPLAFFPPDLAWQMSVLLYVSIASVAAFIWDILNNLLNDCKLVTQYRVNFPTIIYLASRWWTVTSVLIQVVMSTAPIGNCRKLGLRTGWIYPVAMSTTALLCVFRVRSIYKHSKFVTGIFVILWLGLLGGTLTVPLNSRASAIGPTDYCFTSGTFPRYMTASGVLKLVFDAAVYLSITWRLARDFYADEHRSDGDLTTIFRSENLPLLWRALLQDGQRYYLIVTVMQLASTILYNTDSLPAPYRSILGLPTQMIMNIMACRVYRSKKFGLFSKPAVIRREKAPTVTIEFQKHRDLRRSDVELGIMSAPGKNEQL